MNANQKHRLADAEHRTGARGGVALLVEVPGEGFRRPGSAEILSAAAVEAMAARGTRIVEIDQDDELLL